MANDAEAKAKAKAKAKELTYNDYTVGIICPLEVEMTAVRYMLDEEHVRLPGKDGDRNRYILGEMGDHNVAIGCLPQGSQGIGAAATVATDMRRTFPSVQLRLLVGIGGGIPSQKNDIRLGDVVVGIPDGIHGGVEIEIENYQFNTLTLLKAFAFSLSMSRSVPLVQVRSHNSGCRRFPSAPFPPSLLANQVGSNSHLYSTPDGPGRLSMIFIVVKFEMGTITGVSLPRNRISCNRRGAV